MQTIIYQADDSFETDLSFSKNIFRSGDGYVYFTQEPSLIQKQLGPLENLTVCFLRYRLHIRYDYHKLRKILCKILDNYLYEPEIIRGGAIIWLNPGVKTYFYPKKCELIITDISYIDSYIEKLLELMGNVFQLFYDEEEEEGIEEEDGAEETQFTFIINGQETQVNEYGEPHNNVQ